MVRQADDSFVCSGAKPDKGFWTRDLDVTGGGKGTRAREWDKKGLRSWQLAKGDASDQSTPEVRDQSAWDDVQPQWGKMSRHSSSVVEFSLVTHASVSLHMYTRNAVLHNSLSALELTPGILLVCSLSSCSHDCIWCSGKETCVTPIGTTSWSPVVKWNGSKSWCNVGAEAVTSHFILKLA